MSRIVAFWLLLALGLMAVATPLVFSAAIDGSEQHIDVENESFVPTGNSTVTLDDSNIGYATYDDSVAVYNDSGVAMEQTGNYSWNSNNGTLEVVSNSTLENQSDPSVTYGYSAQTQDQRNFTEALIDVNKVWAIIPMVLGVLVLVMFVLGLRGLA